LFAIYIDILFLYVSKQLSFLSIKRRHYDFLITLFATSATAKSKEKEKKHTNTQAITTKQSNENAQKHSV